LQTIKRLKGIGSNLVRKHLLIKQNITGN